MSSIESRVLPTVPEPPTLEFSVRVDLAARTIQLGGELDVGTACLLGSVIGAQVAQRNVRLTVDVTDPRFFDVPGFDAVLAADARLREHGGGLVVVGYTGLVAHVAMLCHAGHLLGNPRTAPTWG